MKSLRRAMTIGLAALVLAFTAPNCGGSSGGSGGGSDKKPITVTEYVDKWLPTDKICLNYNEITTMINGEPSTGIPSYINNLVTEITNCTASINGPGCPYTNAKLDLQEFSDGNLSNGEFNNGDPVPFYLTKNYNTTCQNDGTLEYNWNLSTVSQNPMIFCIPQTNVTNLNYLIKEFLIRYVDNHQDDYGNLKLDPEWDICEL